MTTPDTTAAATADQALDERRLGLLELGADVFVELQGQDAGDLSSVENPEALEEIARVV